MKVATTARIRRRRRCRNIHTQHFVSHLCRKALPATWPTGSAGWSKSAFVAPLLVATYAEKISALRTAATFESRACRACRRTAGGVQFAATPPSLKDGKFAEYPRLHRVINEFYVKTVASDALRGLIRVIRERIGRNGPAAMIRMIATTSAFNCETRPLCASFCGDSSA